MTTMAIEKSFCTTREAARLLGVSIGTVQLWVESGLLQAWKTEGGHRRVLRQSVDSLLHRGGAATTSTAGAVSTGQTQPAAPDGRRMRVMVVEDDAHLLRLYQVHLSGWGDDFELILMDNAISALLSMGKSCPDLLIADLHMPGMDGFDMLRILHQAPEMAATKIVVVTGLSESDIQAKGGLPQGVVVLPKPIPFHQLRVIAQSVLGATQCK